MRAFLAILALLATVTLAVDLPAQTTMTAPADDVLRKHNFDGYIEWMPLYGYVGEWVVAGHRVSVTSRTEMNQKHGAPAVGAYVHVNAMEYRGQLVATRIKVKKPKAR
jgi:hypothetical protein